MKICFITTGNIERVATMKRATGLAEPLINMGHEVHIMAVDCRENRERFALECPRAHIHYFPETSAYMEIRYKKKLIRDINPDFIYICAFVVRNFICKYNIDNSILVVEHSELLSALSSVKYWKRVIYYCMEGLCKYLYHGQIAASKYLENHFKSKLSNKKKRTVLYSPYAYNQKVLLHKTEIYDFIEKKYEGYKIVLYMGNLCLNYGFSFLIEASKFIHNSSYPIKILIMGDGIHKKIAEKYIKDFHLSNSVELLGYVNEKDLGSYFSLADAFISPLFDTVQDWARCPSKLFMYLPFNKPVLTCKIGEAKELFMDNYEYYYDSLNSEKLSKKIVQAVYDVNYVPPCRAALHEWEQRAKDLLIWINETFFIK